MNQPVFLSIDYESIAEGIKNAKKSVYIAIPGITQHITNELINCEERFGGWENINVVLDPAPKIYYLGYGDFTAYSNLIKAGCVIKSQNNLRICLLIIDGDVSIFSPLSLSLESNEEYAESINGISLNQAGSKSVIEATTFDSKNSEPQIGCRDISEFEFKAAEKAIKNNPPQQPDLTRKISVLTSQFQFINISFKGSQLKNNKISLNGSELGIKDNDLIERISGQFKIFNELPVNYEKGIIKFKREFDKIKKMYTRKIGEYGTIIWISQEKGFEEAIDKLQKEVEKFNKSVVSEIVAETEKSKNRLTKFLNDNYIVESIKNPFEQKLLDARKQSDIKNIVDDLFKDYTQGELEKNLEVKYYYFNIASQTASDKDFNDKVEKILGVKLDDLVKEENAFRVLEK